jgi:hypothetical protein
VDNEVCKMATLDCLETGKTGELWRQEVQPAATSGLWYAHAYARRVPRGREPRV